MKKSMSTKQSKKSSDFSMSTFSHSTRKFKEHMPLLYNIRYTVRYSTQNMLLIMSTRYAACYLTVF